VIYGREEVGRLCPTQTPDNGVGQVGQPGQTPEIPEFSGGLDKWDHGGVGKAYRPPMSHLAAPPQGQSHPVRGEVL
jgi:hypothetical protein